MRFVVDILVVMEHVVSPVQFSLQQLVRAYHHPSSGAGTVGPLVAVYRVDSVSPHSANSNTFWDVKKSKLCYDRQSVAQSVLASGTHPEPATNFAFSLRFSLDSCGFVIL
jgi:hypothetical protein